MMRHLVSAVAALILTGSGFGGGDAIAQVEAPPACSKPDLPDRSLQAVEVKGILQRSQAYLECMQKVIETERSKASTMIEAAHAQAEKSNAMIVDVNEFVKKVKDFQAEHQGG